MGQTCRTCIFKISRVIGVLYRLKHVFPREVLLTLCNALILPHLSYCILVWGSIIDGNHRLLLLQKKAVRIITNQDYIAHSVIKCIESIRLFCLFFIEILI